MLGAKKGGDHFPKETTCTWGCVHRNGCRGDPGTPPPEVGHGAPALLTWLESLPEHLRLPGSAEMQGALGQDAQMEMEMEMGAGE